MNTSIPKLNLVFDPFPVLRSDRLVFRQFEESDVEDLFKMRSDPKVMKYPQNPEQVVPRLPIQVVPPLPEQVVPF